MRIYLRFGDRHQQALLDCARSGSAAAHDALLAIQLVWIVRWFERELPACLQSKLDPEDLAQEVSFYAWRRFDQFAGVSLAQYRCWLVETCHNRLVVRVEQYATAQCRELAREMPLSERAIACGKQRPFHHHWLRETSGEAAVEAGEEIERLLSDLSRRRKQVVILHALEERTLSEIAKYLGCSLRSVERDWASARAVLRRRFLDREP
ncbi:MAG: RNA polymerase sigma factor [Pirellulales bacterium]